MDNKTLLALIALRVLNQDCSLTFQHNLLGEFEYCVSIYGEDACPTSDWQPTLTQAIQQAMDRWLLDD